MAAYPEGLPLLLRASSRASSASVPTTRRLSQLPLWAIAGPSEAPRSRPTVPDMTDVPPSAAAKPQVRASQRCCFAMDFYRIPDIARAPSCDKACDELPEYRVTKRQGLFKRPKQYFGCPEYLDTCRAAIAFGQWRPRVAVSPPTGGECLSA